MAGEESVGRVKVEVVPDATGFSKEAEAELKRQQIDPKNVRIVPQIDANLAALTAQVEAVAKSLDRTATINITTNLDQIKGIGDYIREQIPTGAEVLTVRFDPNDEAALKRALETAQQFKPVKVLDLTSENADTVISHIKDSLKEIEARKLQIAAELVLDEKRLEDSQNRMRMRLQTDFDFSGAKEAFDAEMRKLEVEQWKSSVAIGADVRGFDLALAQLKARVVAFGRNLTAQIGLSMDEPKAKLIEASLALLSRAREIPFAVVIEAASRAAFTASMALMTRTRTVQIAVSKKILNVGSVLSGFDAMTKNIEQAHKAITGLFTNLPSVAGVTTALFGLSGALLSTAANVTSMAGSFAQAIPVLLAIPGIAIGIGTMVLAFKDFGKVLPDVVSQLKALQPMISANFWAEAAGPIRGLADTVLPQLTAGFGGVSTALGGFFGNLATTLSGQLDGGVLESWFTRLQESIGTFQGAIQPLVGIFITFGQVGSAMLVPLATLFTELATRFDAWFEGLVAGAGGFQAFADQTVAALGAIIEVIIQVGAIFGAVFRAAQDSGSATFSSIADSMKAWSEGGGLDRLQERLKGLFDAAHTMWDNFGAAASDSLGSAMDNVTKVLGAILPVIGTIMGTLTKLLADALTPEALAGIKAFVDGVGAGVQALAPAFATLGPLIAQLGPVLGTLATVIGQVFGALAPTIGNVMTALTPLITTLGTGLVSVIKAVQPAIEKLAEALSKALADPALTKAIEAIVNALVALAPVLTPIIELAARLMAVLLPVIAAVLEPIAGLIQQIVPLLTPIVNVIVGIVAAIAPLIPMLINLVMAVITPLLPLLNSLLTAILPLLVPIIQLIATVLQLVMLAIQPIIDISLPILVGLLTILIDIIGWTVTAISGFVQGALQWVQDGIVKVSEGIEAFNDKWQEIWNKVLSFFQEIWTGLLNWIKDLLGIHSPSRWFLDLAQNMLQGMLDGLKAGWEWIVGFFTGAWEWLKTTVTDAFDRVKTIVTDAWDAVKLIFSTAWENLKTLVSTGWETIKGLFTNAFDNVKTIVSTAWNEVKTFFTGGVDNAVNTVKELPQKALDGLGDLSRKLWDAGQKLIQGFIDGVKNMFGSVASTLGDLTSKLTSWKGPEARDAVLLYDAGQLVIDGFIDGLESRYDAVRRSLNSLTGDVAATQFNLPNVAGGGLAAIASMIAASYQGQASRTLIYNNYGNSGLSSEEDLFAAAGRGRMVW